MFIGRKRELDFFEKKYNSTKGELIILYGRRRVGKTETLKQFSQNKPHVFFSCTEVSDQDQIKNFSQQVLQKNIPAAKYISCFPDWAAAFESIKELPFEEKKLLIIDEFPYMARSNPSIPSVLQNLWDNELKDQNVMIVLCGSSMSFMEKEILSEKNPLYGRATGILKMEELDYAEAANFFPEYTPEEKITAYSILGGIPHYLKQFDPGLSVKENVIENILTRGSILFNEVEFLMRQELRETATYNSVITAIALGNTKMNDIFQKTQIEKTKLSVYLKNLMDLGIIRREFSMEATTKEHGNVQRGLYRLTDNYFRFWYRFVFPNMSELESGDASGIWNHAIEPVLNEYVSYIFESVCMQYLRKQNREEALPFHFTRIGRWWDKTNELDIMAATETGKDYLIGECKFKNSCFSISDLKHMQEKFHPTEPDCSVYHFLFSKGGFSGGLLALANTDKTVRCVTLENLFE